MSAPGAKAYCRFRITGVLIAGRRHDGEAWGLNPAEAVRRFAAKKAAELKCDKSAAIATATRDTLKKVEAIERA